MMLNCFHATRLMSEYRERDLSIREKMALAVHTAMCSACRRFGHQLSHLSAICTRYTELSDSELQGDQH